MPRHNGRTDITLLVALMAVLLVALTLVAMAGNRAQQFHDNQVTTTVAP